MGDSIPGFRFYPTEEELISFYLQKKLEGIGEEVLDLVIPVLNIYDYTPSDLPQYSGMKCRGDPEQCFFFIPRQESETRGGRPSRLTETGYWKATGSPSYVYSSNNRIIGLKRTMVFYVGRAPQGEKTQWKMNEYKAIQGEASSSTGATPTLRQEFSLCRVYKKTKCLRAFDRRPTGVENITGDPYPTINFNHQPTDPYHGGNDHHDHHEVEALKLITTTHQIVAPPVAVERTSSRDGSSTTSSSGDHHSGEGGGGGPSQTAIQTVAADEAFNWIGYWDNNLNFN